MSTWPLLLEADELAGKLDASELLILDTSSAENYARHHIPGAIHIAPATLQCGIKPAAGKMPSIETLEQLFSQVGLSADKHVVAYDDEGGGWAGRLIWTLDVLGHRRYSYLNGGLQAWLAKNHPVESRANPGTPQAFSAQIDLEPVAETKDILARLDDPNTIIWDARSPEEYRGDKVVARRGGHIPGAVNLDWMELKNPEDHMRLVDLQILQQRLQQMGISPEKTVITHCQSHHRSGLSYLVMKLLGYPNILGYHGSWGEWGNRDDTPVVTGTSPR